MASRFDSIIGQPTDRPPIDNYTSTPGIAEKHRLAAKNGDTIAIGSFRFSLVSASVDGDTSRRFVSLGTTQYFTSLPVKLFSRDDAGPSDRKKMLNRGLLCLRKRTTLLKTFRL